MGKIHEIQLGGVCVKDTQCAAHTHIFSNDMLNKLCLFDRRVSAHKVGLSKKFRKTRDFICIIFFKN